MDVQIIAEIIAGVCVIIAALVSVFIPRWIKQKRSKNMSFMDSSIEIKVKITKAIRKSREPDKIYCSGYVKGCTSGFTLWLASQIGDKIWPKDPIIQPNNNGDWELIAWESGDAKLMTMTVWLSNYESNEKIKKWFLRGQKNNHYPGMNPFPGIRIMAQKKVTIK